MKRIELTTGQFTLVDEDDFWTLSIHQWSLGSGGYARRTVGYKTILMHRVIMKTPEGMITDHINGDKLDNRKENLRVTTRLVNSLNTDRLWSHNTSGVRNVQYYKKNRKWGARVKRNQKHIFLGLFESKDQAVSRVKAFREAEHV
jgi:hypothetical protein